ncbi:hypothetical protein A8C32_01805 [Flavivirga aquatica]|uniref:Uncharacterized protein n=1 Tax=Flavivirga aquatica TaxID=1849968 RepID=A0A1E5TA12_9FLAO|nr:hypothetical protein [Flavivirga aquatica]OEK08223.1 hypothetical protein A8C32_01805 [Flavivirga aquatica]
MSDNTNEDFIDFSEFIEEFISIDTYMESHFEHQTVTLHVEKITTETPCQLHVEVDDKGEVKLGSIPPLYYVETSFMPVFHNIKINFELEENN